MSKRWMVPVLIVALAIVCVTASNADEDPLVAEILAKYGNYLDSVRSSVMAAPMAFGTPFLPSTTVNVMPDQFVFAGNAMTVWGNSSQQSPFMYQWDFGDGAPPTTPTPIADGHYIMEMHAYMLPAGVPMMTYTATLTIMDSGGTPIDTDSVDIWVVDRPSLPTDLDLDGDIETDIEIAVNIAIENGLEYLYLNQQHDGSWFANGTTEGPTGFAVLAYENHGYRAANPWDDAIYAEYIQAGLDHLFSRAIHESLPSVDTFGDPLIPPTATLGDQDPDGDGGLYFGDFSDGSPMYETGMVLMAISATGTPLETVSVSPAAGFHDLSGWTYAEVAEDVVHYFAWAQNEGQLDPQQCDGRGGWRYEPNFGDSDNSVSQWPVIGMEAAERLFGIPIPTFVRPELDIWVSNIQKPLTGAMDDGGSGYQCVDDWDNMGKTGALVAQQEFLGYPMGTPEVLDALFFLKRNWPNPVDETGQDEHLNGNYYAIYGVFKGLDLMLGSTPLPGGLDWRLEYDKYLVAEQDPATGGWPSGTVWFDETLASIAAILCLSRTVIGEDFVDIVDIDPAGFPTIRTSIRVNSPAGKAGTLSPGEFEIEEDGTPVPITDFQFDGNSGLYLTEHTAPDSTADGGNRILLVRVDDPDKGIGHDVSPYTAPIEGVNLSIETTHEANPGDSIRIPVLIDDDDQDVTEHGITQISLTLQYNGRLLDATAPDLVGTLTEGWQVSSFVPGSGEVSLLLEGELPLAGSGELLAIEFAVPDAAPCDRLTPIEFAESTLTTPEGGPVNHLTFDGRFTTLGCVLVWFDCDEPNPNAPGDSIKNEGRPGDVIPIPLNLLNSTGAQIISVTLTVGFDPAVLQLTGSHTIGTATEGWYPGGSLPPTDLVIDNTLGEAQLVLVGEDPLPNQNVLVELIFEIDPGAPAGSTPLDISNLVVVDVEDSTLNSVAEPGCVYVREPPVPVVYIPQVPDFSQPIAPDLDTFSGFDPSNFSAPVAAGNILKYYNCVIAVPNAIGLFAGETDDNVMAYLSYSMDTNNLGMDRGNDADLHPGTYLKDVAPGVLDYALWDDVNPLGSMALFPDKIGREWYADTIYSADLALYQEEILYGHPTLITFQYWNPTPLNQSVDWTTECYTRSIDLFDLGDPVSTSNPGGEVANPEERWNLGDGDTVVGHVVTGVGYIEEYDPDGEGPLPAEPYAIVHDTWDSTPEDIAVPWRAVVGLVTVRPYPGGAGGLLNPGDVSGDGSITALDASLILQYVVGLIDHFPVKDLAAPFAPRDYELRMPALSVKAGDRIQVPVFIDDTLGLMAGGIKIAYDDRALRPVSVQPGETLTDAYYQFNYMLEGEVRFAFAAVKAHAGGGQLFTIEFEAAPNAEGVETPLRFIDTELANSLKVTRMDGLLTILPTQTRLLPNYPNPFNPETWIPYQLAESAPVSIRIFNTTGQLVRSIDLGMQEAGNYVGRDRAIHWDGRNQSGDRVSSGLYFYTLQAGQFTATRRMLVVK